MKGYMNEPREHPKIDLATTIDQMAEQGIKVENSPTKSDQVNKELAEEGGKKDASWKESENQGESHDIYGGMSQ